MSTDLTAAYLRWAFVRAVLARGYWSTAAVYLVVVAGLTPMELVLIGVFQAMTALVVEAPAGVFADTVGRRATLVVAHVVTGLGMAMAGLVTAFPLLVASQCLWGVGWAFASGADVAWLTDEVRRPGETDRVLVAQSRWELTANPVGMVVFAVLAWTTSLSIAIVTAAVGMVALARAVARWPEAGFRREASTQPMLRSAIATFRMGVDAVRRDDVMRAVVVATALVFGGVQAFGRLREERLLDLGLPTGPDPVVWFAALGVLGFVSGVLVLRVLEGRIEGPDAPITAYLAAAVTGVVGLLLVALVDSLFAGAAGVVLVMGVADPVIRSVATISLNRRAARRARATVQSLLWQASHLGVVVFGISLAAIAAVSPAAALTAGAGLLAVAALVVGRTRRGR